MAREQEANSEKRKEEVIATLKTIFRRYDHDPSIVDTLAKWGEILIVGDGFSLEIKDKENRVRVCAVEFSWIGNYVNLRRFDPEGEVTDPPLTESKLTVNSLTFDFPDGIPIKIAREMGDNVLQFEADFGILGNNLAWLSKEGRFQTRNHVGLVVS